MRIIAIDETNWDAFSTMVPGEYMEGHIIGLGCVEEDRILGIVITEYIQQVLQIKFLFTEVNERERGVAKLLLEGVYAVRNQKFPEAPIVCMYQPEHPYAPVLNHLLSMEHFNLSTEESPVYSITRGDLMNSNLVKKYRDKELSKDAVSFTTLTEEEKEKLLKDAATWTRALSLDKEDLEEINEKLSMCLKVDGQIKGVLLIEDVETGIYNLSYLFLHPDMTMQGISFLKAALRNLAFKANDLERLMLTCMDEKIENAVKTLFGDFLEKEDYRIVYAIKA